MGVTKTLDYSDTQLLMASRLKALGHPARIAIVEYLLSVNTCICGDIVEHLSLSQPTISKHLQELKSAGIIRGTLSGNSVCYCLDVMVVKELQDYFASSVQWIEGQDLCCK